MESIFLAILGLSFKAGFLILAAALLRLVLKRAPRRIFCALWLLVGLRLVLPFSIESSLSLIPEMEVPAPTEQAAVSEPEQPTAGSPAVTAPQINHTPVSPAVTAPSLPSVDTTPVVQQQESTSPGASQIAAIVWVCGLGAMLAYLSLSYYFLRRRVREAIPAGDGVWQCAAVGSPFVLGFFRPRIYVSPGMSPEQGEYVLAHERSHIARRDHITKPIGFVILALHWFNPLVWLAYVLMCRDIELACDERVIKGMEAPQRKAYSHALLSCAVKASPLAACPLAFGEVGVKKRIKSVLSYKKPTVWLILAALFCAIAAGVLFLTDPVDSSVPKELRRAIVKNLDSRYEDYELLEIEEKNPLLYSFTYTLERNIVAIPASDPSGSAPSPEYVTESHTEYAYYLHSEWKLTASFGDVPGHILRGIPFDCPNAVWETINAYLAARSSSMEEAQPYYYTSGDSRYNSSILLLEYDIDYVEKQNELLYSFKWTGRREWNEGDALYYRKTGERRRTASELGYVFLINGEWKIASAFQYIPAHILRGEDDSVQIPEDSPAVYDCPDAVLAIFEAYSEACKSSYSEALSHCYFQTNVEKATAESLMEGSPLLDWYEIESVTAVNDSLYEFRTRSAIVGKDEVITAQLFVGYTRGRWQVIRDYDRIPEDISKGLDAIAKYTDPQSLGHPDAAYDCPDAVADAYDRYIASITEGSGDRETWQQLIYRGEDAPELNDPLMFSADLLSDRVESVTMVNGSLYEFVHAYTSKYLDYEVAMQHFVGLIDGTWRIMLYDAVPDALRDGIESVDRWTWDDEGNRVIIPAGSYTDPELPVEAHLMDKLKFYLPAMHSFGTYDLYLGVSGGVPIYYADGTLCGYMELNRAMEASIENGEIVSVRAGANHAGFISAFESIDHSVPCAIAQYSDDSGGYYWYVIFAKADADICYGLKLDTGYFSREEAIRMARSVRFTAEAFRSFDDVERMYWPIIDAYAAALSQGLSPTDLRSLGLNESIGGSEDPLGSFGWAIKDLDGRGHPELLIGEQSMAGGIGTPIYALFTCDAGHNVKEVFSGSTRSMYYCVKDNYFLHRLSAGVGNGSETWYRFYGDYLTELDTAPDTKVYGMGLSSFSAISGYSSSYGVELTGSTPHADYWGYEEAVYLLRSGGESTSLPIPRPADIARRAAEIVNSGTLEELSEADFAQRQAELRYGAEEVYLASDNGRSSMRFVKDEKGFYVELTSGGSLSRYRITDPQQLDAARLLMYNAPQTAFLDWDDPAEYALSNGLELGMDYYEVAAIMGPPQRVETQHSAHIDRSIYYLTYPGEARLCLMAELNAPVEEASLWSAQLYSDTISLGRMGDCGRRINEVCPLYGINPVIIEPGSEYLPVLQNLSIPHDGYYENAIALSPRNEALWEAGPPPCAALLFKDSELRCIYLCYAVAADFHSPVTGPQ